MILCFEVVQTLFFICDLSEIPALNSKNCDSFTTDRESTWNRKNKDFSGFAIVDIHLKFLVQMYYKQFLSDNNEAILSAGYHLSKHKYEVQLVLKRF